MDKVTLKAKNPLYDGMMFGYQFVNGEAKEVPKLHAEYMQRNFGVSIVDSKPVQKVEKVEEKPKPKRQTRKKQGE